MTLQSKGAELAKRATDAVLSPTSFQIVVRSVALSFIIIFALATSLLSSFAFYQSVVPSVSVIKDVYLQYGHSRVPYAFVDLFPTSNQIASNQPYDVVLELLVPANKRNMDLGNFMVNLNLVGKNNETVMSSARPASLAYSQPFIQVLHSLTSPRTLLGWSTPKQTLHVNLASKQILQRSRSPVIHRAFLSVGRQDAYEQPHLATKEIQVYSARLLFHAHFSGLRYIMYHYRLLSYFMLSAIFFMAEFFSALFVWFIFLYRNAKSSTVRGKSPKIVTDPSEEKEEKPSRQELLQRIAAADRQEAAEFEQRMSASASRHPTMGATETVLSSLMPDSRLDEEVLSESDASSQESWQQTNTAPVQDDADIKAEEEDDKQSIGTIGGSSTSRTTSDTFGTLRTESTATSRDSL